MIEHDLSNRDLSTLMTKAGAKVNQSTIWHWTTCKRGYPSESYFGEDKLKALASCLRIDEDELRLALDRSRSLYTEGQWEKNPAPQHDDLKTLRDLLDGRTGEWIRTASVLDLIDTLDAARKHRESK